MSHEARCATAEEALLEALLGREPLSTVDAVHVDACERCLRLRGELEVLAIELASAPEPEAPESLVERTLRRARAELRGDLLPVPPATSLPEGFGRELARLLGGALLPLPLVLAWNATILFFAGDLLSAWLPGGLITLIGAAYVTAAAGWLALLYGALPFLAHLGVRRRLSEALS